MGIELSAAEAKELLALLDSIEDGRDPRRGYWFSVVQKYQFAIAAYIILSDEES